MRPRSLLDALRRALSLPTRCHAAAAVPVKLYTRPGCLLCDELERRLARARPSVAYRLERVDVDSDPALTRRYGDRIPVLEVGGRLACAGRLSEGALGPRFEKLARRYQREGPPDPDAVGRAPRPEAE